MKLQEQPIIFIIDDNPANLKVLNDLLKQCGFKVLIARSGESGLQKVPTVQPDLILLDVLMPGMDGFETCRQLKALPQTRDIPIIFITALADTTDKVKGLSLGAVDYITKPFQQEEVLARIELHLNLRNLTKILEEQNYKLQIEIQQRQQLEEDLKILSLACEQSPVSIVITDSRGNIEYVNPKFESVTGYSFGEVKGQNPRVLKSGYTSDEEYTELWKTISSGQEWYGEFHNKRKNGELYWEFASISPIQNIIGEITHYIAVKEDINDRKAAEEQLRRSEEKFRTIFDHAGDGISIHDFQGKFLEVNQVICERLGYSREELLKMCLCDVDTPEYTDLIPLRLQQLQQQGYLIFETIHVRRDGFTIPIEVNGCLIEFEGQTAILSISRDISQRKEMEEALQKERNFSTAILEIIGALIIVLDLQGRIVSFNHTCEQLTGYSFAEVKDKPFWDFLLLPEDITPIKLGFEDLKRGNFPNQYENYWIAKDGTLHLIEWHNTVLVNAKGESEYIIGTGIDITERKQVENEIRQLNTTLEKRVEERSRELGQSEAKFRKYFEQSLIGMAVFDQYKKWLEVNDCLCQILGYSREELIHITWADVTHPEDLETDINYFNLIVRGELDGYSLDKRFIRKDGQVIYASISVKCLRDGDGSISCFIKLLQDITKRKETEEELQKANEKLKITNAELARATRLKDEFLANMSHELRTPLNAILGMSEGLLEEVYGSLNKQQQKSLKTIEKSGKHLLELINDILDISKIESGKLTLQIAPCHIRSLCTSSLTFVKQQALKKNIKLITSIEEEPEVIPLDERRMRQVLINLLNNAVKFTPEGGKVVLEVRFTDNPATIIFSVIDTGIGIASEDLGKLFQVFTQLDSSLNRIQEGTGLGLALVKRISELHGGSVKVTSELGKGSCFSVILPYQFRNELTPPLKTFKKSLETPKSLSSEHRDVFTLTSSPKESPLILLAEDNEATIETISDYLECKGYCLTIAKNGQEAINLAQTKKPQMILMDISMPEIDGLEAIRTIRTHPDLTKIPIIALTALAMTGDREKCFQAGASEYISKPVSLKQLANTIEQLLNSGEGVL